MAKIKIQKKDIWIDMTPMSDVMTLLLCFFMLTSTFLTPEPVSVTAPNSVSELNTELIGHSIQHRLHVVLVFRTAEHLAFWGYQNVQDILLWNLQL